MEPLNYEVAKKQSELHKKSREIVTGYDCGCFPFEPNEDCLLSFGFLEGWEARGKEVETLKLSCFLVERKILELKDTIENLKEALRFVENSSLGIYECGGIKQIAINALKLANSK